MQRVDHMTIFIMHQKEDIMLRAAQTADGPSYRSICTQSSGKGQIIRQHSHSVHLFITPSPHRITLIRNLLHYKLTESSDSHPSHPMADGDESQDPFGARDVTYFEAKCVLSGAEECPSLQGWRTRLYSTQITVTQLTSQPEAYNVCEQGEN